MGGQVGRINGDVQAVRVETEGQVDRLAGGQHRGLPKNSVNLVSHDGQPQHNPLSVDGQRAGCGIDR